MLVAVAETAAGTGKIKMAKHPLLFPLYVGG